MQAMLRNKLNTLLDAQAKEIKNKVMCEINSFAIVYFFFDDRL
jgi:hypothetical protein